MFMPFLFFFFLNVVDGRCFLTNFDFACSELRLCVELI